jgi:hypothetical protein
MTKNPNSSGEHERLSIEETDAAMRLVDGYGAGEVRYVPVPGFSERIEELLSDAQANESSSSMLSIEDAQYLIDRYYSDDKSDQCGFIGDNNAIDYTICAADILIELQDMVRQGEEDDSELEPSRATLLAQVRSFIAENPDAEFKDPDEPGSFAITQRFLEHYTANCRDILKSHLPEGTIEQVRGDMLATLKLPSVRQYLGPDNCRRMSEEIDRTPVNVVDPLTREIDKKFAVRGRGTTDTLGTFEPKTRRINIDVFTISKVTEAVIKSSADILSAVVLANDNTPAPIDQGMVFKQWLYQVYFHEAVHAATLGSYGRVTEESHDDTPSDSSIKTRDFKWPRFWFEGMTEKLGAYLYVKHIKEVKGEEFKSRSSPYQVREARYRRMAHNRVKKDRIIPAAHGEIARELPMMYPVERIAIDVIIKTGNWAAAGITPQDAERLALRSFLERPVDDSYDVIPEKRLPYTKRFRRALGAATHPGFINKAGRLSSELGVETLLTVIDAPDFDPHDPECLPTISSPAAARSVADITPTPHKSPHFVL